MAAACRAAPSTCRSGRRATRRPGRWWRRSGTRVPSAATRTRWARRPTGRPPPAGWTGASARSWTRRTWPPASAPRSSWPACPTGCGCGRRGGTRCCTRRSATRPAMGATLAGCRAVHGALDGIDDADAAGAVRVGEPANPTGGWSTWTRPPPGVGPGECRSCPTSATSSSPGTGRAARSCPAVSRASWRSTRCRSGRTWPGRAGFYAGDPELVHYLSGCASTPVSWFPDRCRRRRWWPSGRRPRRRPAGALPVPAGSAGGGAAGPRRRLPAAGGAFLWAPAPRGDAWGLAKRLAAEAGVVASPGEFYGPAGSGHVRLAVVQPTDRLELVAERLGVAAGCPPCGTAARLTTLGP